MSSDNAFLAKLRAAAEANGGKPVGESLFYRETGFGRKDLWAAGFDSYGVACEAVGLRANSFSQARIDDDTLFQPLALLARRLNKFPPKGAFEVERARDKAFPSWDTFKRRERQGPETDLRSALVAWCRRNEDFQDVGKLLEESATPNRTAKRSVGKLVIKGYVYMMKYGGTGSVYKIGLSDNVPRRHAQLNSMAPQDMRIIHSIPTDDPEGIERYWLARFEPMRLDGKKELFRLSADEVAAFKARRYQ